MNREQIFMGESGTYIVEIALILLGAFILGYVLRLLLNDGYKSKIEELEHENAMHRSRSESITANVAIDKSEVESLQEKIKALTNEKTSINERLSDCYARRIKLENEVKVLNRKLDEVQKLSNIEESTDETPMNTSAVLSSTVSESDDLKRIEGIGPKIEQLLNAGGIKSYSDVKQASVDEIKAILITAGPTYAVHDPSTWGEQAALAEANNWDKLKELQEELKGGKRL